MNHLHDTIDPDETLSTVEAHADHHEHITSFATMTWVFVLLLFFTALTFWTSRQHHLTIGHTVIEFGPTPHIVVALLIAIIKGGLVAMFFMHLKYDKPLNTVIVGATIFAVILFLGLTISDLAARKVISPNELSPIVLGGDTHYDPNTGERTKGAGVTQAARQRNPKAFGQSTDDEHSDTESSSEDSAGH